MRNKIEDLRAHLFAQLERLNDDEDMKNPIKLEKELKRAQAICDVGSVLVSTAKAETEFIKAFDLAKPPTGFFVVSDQEQKRIESNPMKGLPENN